MPTVDSLGDGARQESQGVVEEGLDSAPFVAMFNVIESLRKHQVDLALSCVSLPLPLPLSVSLYLSLIRIDSLVFA